MPSTVKLPKSEPQVNHDGHSSGHKNYSYVPPTTIHPAPPKPVSTSTQTPVTKK